MAPLGDEAAPGDGGGGEVPSVVLTAARTEADAEDGSEAETPETVTASFVTLFAESAEATVLDSVL